jgi:hypothetical protein
MAKTQVKFLYLVLMSCVFGIGCGMMAAGSVGLLFWNTLVHAPRGTMDTWGQELGASMWVIVSGELIGLLVAASVPLLLQSKTRPYSSARRINAAVLGSILVFPAMFLGSILLIKVFAALGHLQST